MMWVINRSQETAKRWRSSSKSTNKKSTKGMSMQQRTLQDLELTLKWINAELAEIEVDDFPGRIKTFGTLSLERRAKEIRERIETIKEDMAAKREQQTN